MMANNAELIWKLFASMTTKKATLTQPQHVSLNVIQTAIKH